MGAAIFRFEDIFGTASWAVGLEEVVEARWPADKLLSLLEGLSEHTQRSSRHRMHLNFFSKAEGMSILKQSN